MRDFFNKRRKCLVAVRIVVMPRNLALVNGFRRHVIANPRISEFRILWRFGINESQSRPDREHSSKDSREGDQKPLHRLILEFRYEVELTRNFEIGRFLHFKSEIRNLKLNGTQSRRTSNLRSWISDLKCR